MPCVTRHINRLLSLTFLSVKVLFHITSCRVIELWASKTVVMRTQKCIFFSKMDKLTGNIWIDLTLIFHVNPFLPTVAFSQHLLSERPTSLGIMGEPEVPPLGRETSVSRTANLGTWLRKCNGGQKWVNYFFCVILSFWDMIDFVSFFLQD